METNRVDDIFIEPNIHVAHVISSDLFLIIMTFLIHLFIQYIEPGKAVYKLSK